MQTNKNNNNEEIQLEKVLASYLFIENHNII